MTGLRTMALSCAALCCWLAACAVLPSRRAQDADAHYRMATAVLQQPGGIQSEINRRAAYPELTLAIKLDPKKSEYHRLLGTFHLYDKDYAAAERETLRALELDPNLAESHNNLGMIYMAQGRLSEAAAQFRKALANLSYPNPEYAANNLGNVEYQLGDYAAAVEAFERSLAILPNHPEARFKLGMSYARLGRLTEAESAFTAALQMRPDVARTRYELGMVLFKLGRKQDAAVQFRRVVELDSVGDLGEQSRTYLKLLK